ncbi:MAG: fibrobacter succinogenes major paralogous domain-containing protein [Bacteroidales bacterium]
MRTKLVVLITAVLFLSCHKEEPVFNPDKQYGSLSDIENNTYKTIRIGNQVWMAENLRATKYNDGSVLSYDEDGVAWSGQPGAYCWYNQDKKAYKSTYGALYNWSAVNSVKLCPEGWHVPGIEEWKTLRNHLITNGFNFDGTLTGNKIAKSLAATVRWEPSDLAGSPGNDPAENNTSGFSALPAGFRDPTHGWNTFKGMGSSCGWWSSTGNGDSYALHSVLSNNYEFLLVDDPDPLATLTWNYAFSVRCVKD